MRAFFLALCLAVLPVSSIAAPKVALVIGNSNYKVTTERLKNPVNDAQAIATRLKALGFETELLRDAKLDDMLDGVARVKSRVDPGGTVFFYYAGHGVQLEGSNFLVPVDARMATREKARRESVQLSEVMDGLNGSPAAVRLLVVDACRNDPFPRQFRSGNRGLAREDLRQAQGSGMMVLYAASPGEVAADGSGSNGLFTSALLQAMEDPGKELPKLMDDVTQVVQRASGGAQNPYYEGTGLSRFALSPGAGSVGAQPPASQPAVDAEMVFWNSIQNSTDAGDYGAYLKKYPQGAFAELAKIRLEISSRSLLESLRSFTFEYQYKPMPGLRIWSYQGNGRWTEKYPDSQVTEFKEVRRDSVDGCSGIVVQRTVGSDEFLVFIPEKGCQRMWVRFRTKGNEWAWLAEMKDVH